jgi:hypothetical protein
LPEWHKRGTRICCVKRGSPTFFGLLHYSGSGPDASECLPLVCRSCIRLLTLPKNDPRVDTIRGHDDPNEVRAPPSGTPAPGKLRRFRPRCLPGTSLCDRIFLPSCCRRILPRLATTVCFQLARGCRSTLAGRAREPQPSAGACRQPLRELRLEQAPQGLRLSLRSVSPRAA